MTIIDEYKADNFNPDLFITSYSGLNAGFWLGLLYYILLIFQMFMIFMLGACLCGFFQCMIYRIDKKINPLIPRSFCESCGKTLRFIDAVPFVNYLLLKGKSRCCKMQLPGKYFVSETISGTLTVILFLSPVKLFVSIPLIVIIIFITACIFYRSLK